jgi:hypothetical protein
MKPISSRQSDRNRAYSGGKVAIITLVRNRLVHFMVLSVSIGNIVNICIITALKTLCSMHYFEKGEGLGQI